jgi:ribonuclease P protein component
MADGSVPSGGRNLSRPTRRTLPKGARLLRHADFERVYKLGQRHFATNMTVFYLEREKPGSLRIGFTVSRALGGAVQRNRMKRRLREAIRLYGLPSAPFDVVVNPKKSLLTADFKDLQAQVARAMQVIGKAEAIAMKMKKSNQ